MEPTSEHILDHLPDGILVADASGHVQYLNAAAEHMLGRAASRSTGHALDTLLSRAPDLLQLASEAFSSGGILHRPDLATGARAKGLRVDAGAARLPDGGVVLSLRDRSLTADLARAEQRTQELSSLRAVASGVAHEVKNPLGGMRGAAQLLARELENDDPRREYVDVLVEEIDRVAGIIDRLRDLAHPPAPADPVPVDLNRILHEIALMEHTATAGGAEAFDLRFDPSLPEVPGDPAALKAALLNLVKNACEAAADSTAPVRIGTAVATGMAVRDAAGTRRPLVRVEIADRGAGIAPEALEKIFVPFYTTKAHGTGLGLATTQRIVASHGGTITVESEEGQGTRFVVTLPAGSPNARS